MITCVTCGKEGNRSPCSLYCEWLRDGANGNTEYRWPRPFIARCVECGAEDATADFEPKTRAVLLARRMCFVCSCWTDRVQSAAGETMQRGRLKPTRRVVVDGTCYYVGPEPHPGTPSHCLGFGGSRFVIDVLATGERIETRNLWCSGDVPAHFRDRLPDDARFEREAASK